MTRLGCSLPHAAPGTLKLCSGVQMRLSVSDWSLWEISSATKWRLTPSLSASPCGAASAGGRGRRWRGCLKSTGLDSAALTAEWAQWIINHGISQWLWSPACHITLHQVISWESMFFLLRWNIPIWPHGCRCYNCQACAPVTSNMKFSYSIYIYRTSRLPMGNHSEYVHRISLYVALRSFVDLVWSRNYLEAVMVSL